MGILDVPFPKQIERANGYRSMRSLNNIQQQKSGLTNSPTISLSSSVSGSTGTQITAVISGVLQTNKFSFLNGIYRQAGSAYPEYNAVRDFPTQNSVFNYGSAVVEFMSDSPAISFYQPLAQAGMMRLLVDSVEVYKCATAIRTGTAQIGSTTTTIKLDSGASATNNFYNTRAIRITGGTGIGQTKFITGYVGSTKVATINSAWTTIPDITSTFEIAASRQDNNTSSGLPFVLLDWAGERRMRKYRVEFNGNQFNGCYVTSAIDSVIPAVPTYGQTCLWFGDSFSAGTGASGSSSSNSDSLAAVACADLGWTLVNCSIGGTGYLNPTTVNNGTIANVYDRMFPPTNAWFLQSGYFSTAGSFTLSQSGITTAAIPYNATTAQVQSALDTVFGSGLWTVIGPSTLNLWIYGINTNASNTAVLTADFTGQTGGLKTIERYTGEIVHNLPKDGNGNYLPFNLVLAYGHNDTVSGGWTRAALTTKVNAIITKLVSTYSMATIFVIGNMFLPGGGAGTDSGNANSDILAGCANLPKINGTTPFIDTLTTPWMTGTGYIGNSQNNGNSDITCSTDGVHPSFIGHQLYGHRIARSISDILGTNII